MHTVELLEQAIRAASALGYTVRQEWLNGAGGGECEIKGRKYLFLDLSLGVHERLRLVSDALQRDNAPSRVPLSEPLRRLLGLSHSDEKAA
jgi:hypothetical protein